MLSESNFNERHQAKALIDLGLSGIPKIGPRQRPLSSAMILDSRSIAKPLTGLGRHPPGSRFETFAHKAIPKGFSGEAG